MITQLSILIPVYNDSARELVAELQRQAQAVEGLRYEILVVDDGSTDEAAIAANKAACALPCCRYVSGPRHDCRAAMRNAMARQGTYEWRLMVDARLKVVRQDFIRRYLDSGARAGDVVCGGVTVDGGADTDRLYRENLRFRYERHEQAAHSAEARRQEPYKAFRTTNFFHHRTVLERVPYDERIKGYGYEDVMLGKALCGAGVRVIHIDNPVAYTSFEDNARYLAKVDEAMLTLDSFSAELAEYSPLVSLYGRLKGCGLAWLVKLWHQLFGALERRQLCGSSPSLLVLKMYKLGKFGCLVKTIKKSKLRS